MRQLRSASLWVLSASVVLLFVIWVEVDPTWFHRAMDEDGPIENLTALLFGLSGLGFIVFASRSDFLKSRKGVIHYFFSASWALLMLIFCGEEISWGQRIFGFETPAPLARINVQDEFNVHNIEIVHTFWGGKYRYLSIMMLTTGLLLPLLAWTHRGRRVVQFFAFPVAPFCYAPLFVGAYIYGKYYHPIVGNDAAEVRECIVGFGMFAVALHGALDPRALFRLPEPPRNRLPELA